MVERIETMTEQCENAGARDHNRNCKNQSRKILNWKIPGRVSVQGYWIKNLISMHERIAIQMNEIVCGVRRLPECLTYGGTVLCQKDPIKGGTVDSYRPTITAKSLGTLALLFDS